jgi:hypothetical protein
MAAMHCDFCQVALSPNRLFCAGCGEVTPEGKRVMSPDRVGESFSVPMASAPLAGRVKHAPRETSSAAVLSLVFGLLSYVFLPFVGALIAIVTGHVARREIRVAGGRMEGQMLATTGLVLGYSQVVLASVAILFAFCVAVLAIVSGHH